MYEKFEPLKNTRLALNYLTSMVDKKIDNLPYWCVYPQKKIAEARHSRVDDAELVGSWYEGIDAAIKMLNTDEGKDVRESFRRHLLKSWGQHGLRFHEEYPWSKTIHSSFHEMAYILSAMNCMLENNPQDEEAEKKVSELVKGMRSLVIERKVKTFWSGDFEETEPVYEFPNDVFLRDGGFDLTRHTGRGEQAIRNAILIHPLVCRYEAAQDETALDLATGLANYLLGPSHYFNYKMEFFGHVHSAGWTAAGLVRLGRVLDDSYYIEKGKGIYDYIRSISSSFGWVPEYAQWHPMKEEHSETCCIKDMIQCAHELILCGYDEYWNDINLFVRNQLIENQVRVSDYITVDNTLPDTASVTYRDIDKRILGGFSGGALPNSISLSKFRSIAGCCCGTAPVALKIAWDAAVDCQENRLTVNIPVDKTTENYEVHMEYPNEGKIVIIPKRNCDVAVRLYSWMGENKCGKMNGCSTDLCFENGFAIFKNAPAGAVLEFFHDIETITKKEKIMGTEFNVVWRGCDVVDILPKGEHLRLYQRDNSVPKYYPSPGDIDCIEMLHYGPTQQTNTSHCK